MSRHLSLALVASIPLTLITLTTISLPTPAFAQAAQPPAQALKTAAVGDAKTDGKGDVKVAQAALPASVANIAKDRNGRPKAKETLAACKADAAAKNLAAKEERETWIACYRQARPDLAKRFDCRKEAKAKGLKDEALKAAMKECRSAG
jgi:hypothetical protein